MPTQHRRKPGRPRADRPFLKAHCVTDSFILFYFSCPHLRALQRGFVRTSSIGKSVTLTSVQRTQLNYWAKPTSLWYLHLRIHSQATVSLRFADFCHSWLFSWLHLLFSPETTPGNTECPERTNVWPINHQLRHRLWTSPYRGVQTFLSYTDIIFSLGVTRAQALEHLVNFISGARILAVLGPSLCSRDVFCQCAGI